MYQTRWRSRTFLTMHNTLTARENSQMCLIQFSIPGFRGWVTGPSSGRWLACTVMCVHPEEEVAECYFLSQTIPIRTPCSPGANNAAPGFHSVVLTLEGISQHLSLLVHTGLQTISKSWIWNCKQPTATSAKDAWETFPQFNLCQPLCLKGASPWEQRDPYFMRKEHKSLCLRHKETVKQMHMWNSHFWFTSLAKKEMFEFFVFQREQSPLFNCEFI